MDTVPDYGIAKTQKLPYSYWAKLRNIETREQLVDFFMQNPATFTDFLAKRTSPGKVKDIFERKKIDNNSEFDFLCESTKSAIFRAGGSNIMDWGCWYVDDGRLYSRKISSSENEILDIYGTGVELPLGYSVALPRQLYQDMRKVTLKIHEEARAYTKGPKLLTRVDFIVTDANNACIVDVGESNTTIGLADALYAFSGLGKRTFLEKYLARVLEEQKKITPDIKRIFFVSEDQKMIDNLPYEFSAMENLVKSSFCLEASTILKEDLPSVSKTGDSAFVRCFRGIPPCADLDIKMIDDISSIYFYNKDHLYRILDKCQASFPSAISIPRHSMFGLRQSASDALAEKVYRHAEESGLKDFVIKPSVKSSRSSSLAFLYSSENPVHLRQLKKTIKKLNKEEHIPYLIVEENIGSGISDGKKLEVRLHCLSE